MIENADPYGLIFSSQDLTTIESYRDTLLDDLLSNSCHFFEFFKPFYEKRASTSIQYLNEILSSETFEIVPKDTILFEKGKIYVSEDQIKKRWAQWIQFILVDKIYEIDSIAVDQDSLFKVIAEREQCRISQTYGVDENKAENIYLNAIANTYDPHTTYMPSEKKEAFLGSLKDSEKSFGLELTRNDHGQLYISSMVPGGSAWKSNQIDEGDIVLKVFNKKLKIEKDFFCISYADAQTYLRSDSIQKLTFILEKEEGIVDSVTLVKTKMNVEENIIKSFILHKKNQKIGYITLPSFYSNDGHTKGCASDIATELIRLKREGIEGLILDLRDNGGGYMSEAIKLSGIFINYGPVGIFKRKDQDPRLMRDEERGSIFSKPLVIMVNQFSASAAEFFTITMKDYHRAIVVGHTSYGKSTAQNVFPLNAHEITILPSEGGNEGDFVKITTGRFFRVDGTTYQKNGIEPDIEIPNIYQEFQLGEREYENAMDPIRIDKETYFKEPSEVSYLPILRDSSAIRVRENEYFKYMTDAAKLVHERYENQKIPIGIEEYKAYKEYYKNALDPYYSKDADPIFEVDNPSYLNGFSDLYDQEKELNQSVMESIAIDIEIQETFLIIKQYINQ